MGEDNRVRGIDACVETLDMDALGFCNAGGNLAPGQPPYAPGAMLTLYIFGYINRVHSSRRLAREGRRNRPGPLPGQSLERGSQTKHQSTSQKIGMAAGQPPGI